MNEDERIDQAAQDQEDFDSMVQSQVDREIGEIFADIGKPFPSGLNRAGWGGLL